MIQTILKLLPIILGWFGFGAKDERDLERAAGEKLGQKEVESAGLEKFIKNEEDADATRRSVDPAGVWSDPDNRANPSTSAGKSK